MPSPRPPRKNIELKARIYDMAAARRVARRLTQAEPVGLSQVDTYFRVNNGRLKLREINATSSELIGYQRPDQTEAKASQYRILSIDDPDCLKTMLEASIGVRAVVRKHRSLYLYENVRIHLDVVDGLGDFIEFEAVLTAKDQESGGIARVSWLQESFRIDENDLLSTSYVDMIDVS